MGRVNRRQRGIYGMVQQSIIEYRRNHNLSQQRLANILGVGDKVVHDWEHGRKAAFRFLWRTWWQGPLPASDLARAILAAPLAGWALDNPTGRG